MLFRIFEFVATLALACALAFGCWLILSQFDALTTRALLGFRLDVILSIWTGPALANQVRLYRGRQRAMARTP